MMAGSVTSRCSHCGAWRKVDGVLVPERAETGSDLREWTQGDSNP
jgi:hypothetical protein